MSATPTEALERSRVDVVGMIRNGIPTREYVPGLPDLLPKAKRVHVTADKKTGKSLAVAGVTAVEIVAAGGTVVVLDRENGADEYARRLRDVLAARGDDALHESVRKHLRYHAWPSLSLDWRDDPSYPEAFTGADVAIFDSSRSHLTPLNLKEDDSDDFAAFTTALIDPLMQVGTTTITLDNSGHLEKDRARGTSAKEDLCDIAFTMKVISPFSCARAGRVELRCTAARIGEITPGDAWQMELGGGHFGMWQKIGARPPEARDELREAVLEVLVTAGEPMGVNKIAEAIRERASNTLKFSDTPLREALKAWAADPASGVGHKRKSGYFAHGEGARHGGHGAPWPPQLAIDPSATAGNPVGTGDLPMAESDATARHGGHGGSGHPLRGATPRHDGSENGHDELPEGWSLDDLEAIAAERAESGEKAG